jgi:hypothetical protein
MTSQLNMNLLGRRGDEFSPLLQFSRSIDFQQHRIGFEFLESPDIGKMARNGTQLKDLIFPPELALFLR